MHMGGAGDAETCSINRRKLLAGLGAAASAGMAGCGNNQGNGGGGGELGERVPSFPIPYWSNLGGDTVTLENIVPIVSESLAELGINAEAKPVEFTKMVSNVVGDKRTSPLPLMYYSASTQRLDTHNQLQKFVIERAGAGGDNMPHFTSCEYDKLVRKEGVAPSEERRMELASNAWKLWSSDVAGIPLVNRPAFGAARVDAVEVNGAGKGGIHQLNPNVFIKSQPKQGNLTVSTSPTLLQTTNFHISESFPNLSVWNKLVHSPLYQYDPNYELLPVLAAGREITNDGKTVTIDLKDSTFHNGDPVTAEDAKFTYEHLLTGGFTSVRLKNERFKSIKAIDEKTIQFNFDEPFLPFIRVFLTLFGILHKDTWVEAGAKENPRDVEPGPMPGSGPFEISNLETGQSMELQPHEDHAVFQPGHGVVFQVHRSNQSAQNAFTENEIQFITGIAAGTIEQLNNQLGDKTKAFTRDGFMNFMLWPQMQMAPTKFRELRMAIGQSINRQKINQLALYGRATPQFASSFLASTHPLYSKFEDGLTTFTDNPQGDIEAAKQTLSEAGWGWDDQGNLHYPPEADLSPLWPKGGEPSPEDFPCIDSESNYVPPEKR